MSGRADWSARRPLAMGLIALALLLGGTWAWAGTARLAGAIIAAGEVAVAQNRQIVQHPDGGVVDAIFAREGDRVAVGDVLLHLDPARLASQLTIAETQLIELMARRGRLEAERDERAEIAFDPLLHDIGQDRPIAATLMAGQRRLLAARVETAGSETRQLGKRRGQITDQIAGITAQEAALGTQAALIAEERVTQRSLLDRGLTQASRLSALRREEARITGTLGELAAQKAQAESRITETEIELLKLRARRREEAITTLRDLHYRELELRERRAALQDRLTRLDIVAPIAGVIYDLRVFGPRAVLSPAEPILYIVPQDRPLVVSARVPADDIDLLHPGQDVILRLPALDRRTTPELSGRVAQISPDVFRDERTGGSFYRARVTLGRDERRRLAGGTALVPGMPVEVFFRTGDMTPLAYLVKPLSDYFARAFRG